MRIAIVDDNQSFAENMKQVVEDCLRSRQETAEIRYCANGYGILGDVEEGRNYDIYFLDVEMPAIDGLELAQRIRRLEPEANIVFVTSYEKYAVPSYKLRANYYILKEEYRQEVPLILERIWQHWQEEKERTEKDYYVIENDIRTHRIRLDDILYLCKEQKYTVFHCRKGTYRERLALNQVHQKLPGERFIFVERGYIVNLKYVSDLRGQEITLSDGENECYLPVSRQMAAGVRDQVALYWRKR